MNRIYLVGFMGAGKTTLGKRLAKRLGYGFYDLDKAFEHKYKTSVDLFFNKYGEELFRKLEHELLVSTVKLDNTVISTGGGTPCFYNGMEFMNENGVTIYIKLTPSAIFNRLTKVKKRRPLVSKKSDLELKKFIEEKLQEREQYYNRAAIVISGISVKIDLIVNLLRQEKNKG